MAKTGWPGEAEWPPDLRAAMDRVSDTMRQFADSEVGALRAALSIALDYVVKPEPVLPEVHVMYAEEAIAWSCLKYTDEWRPGLIYADTVYFVCPECGNASTSMAFWQPAMEVASAELDWNPEDPVGEFWVDRAGWDSGGGDGSSYFVCQGHRCGARLAVPGWLNFET